MNFVNIALQAELNRFEDSEFEEIARRNCHEDPDTRQQIIQVLRSMILERGECNPRRSDDAYLLRFLRCRQFIPALAHRLMVRYEEFRRENAELYNCDIFGLTKVRQVYSGVLPESPDVGRVIIAKCGQWKTDEASIIDVVKAGVALIEVMAQQPKLQILGITVILDLDGLNVTQISHLTPHVARQIVNVFGVALPLLIHGVHFINYGWILNTCLFVFKPFIPKYFWSRIHFHGCDVNSLHKYVNPKCLPPEYEGCCKYTVSMEEVLTKINKYKDDFFVRDMRDLGYIIKD